MTARERTQELLYYKRIECEQLLERIEVLEREFDIVDNAAEFWKDTAIDLGYDDGSPLGDLT